MKLTGLKAIVASFVFLAPGLFSGCGERYRIIDKQQEPPISKVEIMRVVVTDGKNKYSVGKIPIESISDRGFILRVKRNIDGEMSYYVPESVWQQARIGEEYKPGSGATTVSNVRRRSLSWEEFLEVKQKCGARQ